MTIVEINMVHSGSTGRIMLGIAKTVRENGGQAFTFSSNYYVRGRNEKNVDIDGHAYFGCKFENMIHWRLAQLTGFQGYGSIFGTHQLLKRIDEIRPDVIHLHNLHNRSINVPMVFKYIKKHNIKTVWTLHDCWAVTGQCPHFSMVKCGRWRSGCYDCPQISTYPSTFFDRTRYMWKRKRQWFTGVRNLTIVTPSKWLEKIVKQSYLNEYPVKVVNNGIDLNTFKYYKKNPRKRILLRSRRNGRNSKKIVLAVSMGWSPRKGFELLKKIAIWLKSDYQLVVVGIDYQMSKRLPDDVICISKTKDQIELARIYSAADVFINPTLEDSFPTVNLEALACGTPVITFDTGGSPESIDSNCGAVVEWGNIKQMLEKIDEVCEDEFQYTSEAAINRAKLYDEKEQYKDYLDLYIG